MNLKLNYLGGRFRLSQKGSSLEGQRAERAPEWNISSYFSAFSPKPELVAHYFLKVISDDLLNTQSFKEKVFQCRIIDSESYYARGYAVG